MKKIRIAALLMSMTAAMVLCSCGLKKEDSGGTAAGIQTQGAQNSSVTQSEQETTTPPTDGTQAETAAGGERQTEELLASLDFNHNKLDRVVSELDRNGIHYTGYYNVSGERLDLTLQDGTLLVFLETRDPEKEYWERTGNYELMMKGNEFNGNGFQENYLNEYDVTTEEYMYPNLSGKEWDSQSSWLYNQTDLSIARNQVFAGHGRKFTDPFLNAVFSEKSWYEPQYEGSEFDGRMQEFLTETEKENLKIVMEWEEEQNFRKTGDYERMKGLLSGSWLDLDDDGQEEQIFYQMESEDPEGEIVWVTLTIRRADGSEEKVEKEMCNPHKTPYVCSMEKGRNQLVLAENGMSADFIMEFFAYENGKIASLGSVSTYPGAVQVTNGKLSAPVESYHIQCEPVSFTYALTGGKLVKVEQDYYEYRGNEVTALKELDLYAAPDDAKPAQKLKAQEHVKILGGDLKKWVKLERVADGTEFWIPVEDGECIMPDGSAIYTGEAFDGLTFYG